MTRHTLFIDTETYSEVELKKVGAYAYAQNCEIILVAYAVGDARVEVCSWPEFLANPPVGVKHVCMHNKGFDAAVFAAHGWEIPADCIIDTMAIAHAHALPDKLATLSKVYKLGDFSKLDGSRLITRFTKPDRKGRRYDASTHPAQWEAFVEYARRDVEAMRELYKRLPAWNLTAFEREVELVDAAINARGFCVDVGLARKAAAVLAEQTVLLDERMSALTGGAVQSARQVSALTGHLAANGVAAPDMRAATVTRMLADPEMSEDVKDLLRIREQAGTTSTAKIQTLLGCEVDGRLRGTLQYCGAGRTGRWAGRLFQPQNLTRPGQPECEILANIAALQAGEPMPYGPSDLDKLSWMLRSMIIAPDGRKLVVSDLSNIEGRVLAWLAGEDWKLQAYREYDNGVGDDLYKLTYAKAFGVPVESVTKDMRLVGKVMELALGYRGAVGAFRKMSGGTQLENLSDGYILGLVRKWREANPRIRSLWSAVEKTVQRAVANRSQESCRGMLIMCTGPWLVIRLPSGRYLSYASPAMTAGQVSYMGVDGITKRWRRHDTYGGRLVENITQAVARDILAYALVRLESAGWEVVLHAHDEVVCELDDCDPRGHTELNRVLATPPPWAEGLPLAASGYTSQRYKKD